MFVRELHVVFSPRRDLPGCEKRICLRTPAETARFLDPIFDPEPVEVFLGLFLNTRHTLLGFQEISRGSVSATVVHPREVFKAAILANAMSVLLAHNHPSGDPTPSPDDVALTARLVQAGGLLGIDVVDHLILGNSRYFSFLEAGRLGECRGSQNHSER